jgi:hypothetical protein
MSTMRVYTREFRESADGLVLSQSMSIRVAAEDLGVPSTTRCTIWSATSGVRGERRLSRRQRQRSAELHDTASTLAGMTYSDTMREPLLD